MYKKNCSVTDKSQCIECEFYSTCDQIPFEGTGSPGWLFFALILLVIGFILFGGTKVFGNTNPIYSAKLDNAIQTSASEFEFDITVEAESEFLITAYQCALTFNDSIGTGLTFTYLNGSSQLSNTPLLHTVKVYSDNGDKKLAFGSAQGYDLVSTRVRIGRFKLKSATPFEVKLPNVRWSFSGNLKTIITGEFFSDITNPDYFSDLKYNQPLPVQLTQFSAVQIADSIVLSWSTKTETNSYGFGVYRSQGLKNYTQIGFLPSAGNSSSERQYSFSDRPKDIGTYFYKLELIEYNGRGEFNTPIQIEYKYYRIINPNIDSYWIYCIAGVIFLYLIYFLFIEKRSKNV